MATYKIKPSSVGRIDFDILNAFSGYWLGGAQSITGSTNIYFETVNGGSNEVPTDNAYRLVVGANKAGADINWRFAYPSDLDDTQPITVKMLVAKNQNTDATAKFTVRFWEGVGDTIVNNDTVAITELTPTLKTVTIAANDIGAYPNFATIRLSVYNQPNDAVYLYACWIEYTRI